MTGGFNFPAHRDGVEVQARLLEMLERGEIRPVVDRVVPFAELPAALEAMAGRETIGRVIVLA
jgi:NADPH2:quinone reductase